jgi:putative nucleotidyltransferase with HDIG domain
MSATIEETKDIFEEGKQVVEDLMHSARTGKALDQVAIRKETTKILTNIQKDHLVSFALLDLKNFDGYTFVHSVNVAVLSVAFAHHMKFTREKVLAIGQGSILHDIGKAKIPIDILNKPGKLNAEEFKLIQAHPSLGVQLLEQESLSNEIIKEIILHHHEDYDGSGYPDKIGGTKMKRYAAIVAVADFYDALTTKRAYKDIILPAEAVNMILSQSGKKFDPRVVNHFVKTIGIYPVGTTVELSDERIATVIAFSPLNLLQPVVKINNPNKDIEEIISLVNSDLYITGVHTDSNMKTYEIFGK